MNHAAFLQDAGANADKPSDTPSPVVHAAGPGSAARQLRDLLEQHVDAVPAGGAIDWMTYYFRDEALADALVRAARRGVAVRLCVEKRPRHRGANDRVIRRLADPQEGIGPGLAAVGHRLPLHLHTKLYAFSHPRPHVLVGSFNPSGNAPEDPAVIADIGDQDRGHNLLVELADQALVARLVDEVRALHASGGAFRLHTGAVRDSIIEAFLFPRLGPNPLVKRLRTLGRGASLRIVASHVRDPLIARLLGQLVGRGVDVKLLTGSTTRRTPRKVEAALAQHGIDVRRFAHSEHLPMHSKFVLARDGEERWAAFGSYNFTLSSRWLNHELLMFASDAQLWLELDRLWDQLLQSVTPAQAD